MPSNSLILLVIKQFYSLFVFSFVHEYIGTLMTKIELMSY